MKTFILLFSTAMLFASIDVNAQPKIKKLADHIAVDQSLKGASTLDKLSAIAKLSQEKRLDYKDKTKNMTIYLLVKKYMTEKGKRDPLARLKALAELYEMESSKKPLYRLGIDKNIGATEFITYLSSLDSYQKGTLERKSQILGKMKNEKTWSEKIGLVEIEKVTRALIEQKTSKLPPKEQGMQALKLLSSLRKSELLKWGSSYINKERYYLHKYLNNNPSYQKMNSKQKIYHLNELEADKLITSFLQTDVESVIVAETLFKDPKFKQNDIPGKHAIIEKMYKMKEIHLFSRNKIIHLLGLPSIK